MQKVGEDWENGVVTEAQEHFISNLIVNRFYQFFRIHPSNPMLPKVLAFCPSGEQHYVGLLLFTLFLRRNGVDVIYLGADTPTDSLMPIIRDKNISIIIVSTSNGELLVPVYEWLRTHKYELYHVQVIIGGQGHIEVPEDVNARHMSSDLEEWKGWFEETIRPL
jgi:methanogenic corrinoid protein MtbC1